MVASTYPARFRRPGAVIGVSLVLSLAAVLTAAPALAVTQPNDNFGDRIVISGTEGNVNGSNVDATEQGGEPNNAGVSEPIESVWYEWTAPRNGGVNFNTCAARTGYDTTLGVYVATTVPPNVRHLSSVAENDDFCGAQSRVEFSAVAGTTYYISVDGFASEEGRFSLGWFF